MCRGKTEVARSILPVAFPQVRWLRPFPPRSKPLSEPRFCNRGFGQSSRKESSQKQYQFPTFPNRHRQTHLLSRLPDKGYLSAMVTCFWCQDRPNCFPFGFSKASQHGAPSFGNGSSTWHSYSYMWLKTGLTKEGSNSCHWLQLQPLKKPGWWEGSVPTFAMPGNLLLDFVSFGMSSIPSESISLYSS